MQLTCRYRINKKRSQPQLATHEALLAPEKASLSPQPGCKVIIYESIIKPTQRALYCVLELCGQPERRRFRTVQDEALKLSAESLHMPLCERLQNPWTGDFRIRPGRLGRHGRWSWSAVTPPRATRRQRIRIRQLLGGTENTRREKKIHRRAVREFLSFSCPNFPDQLLFK